MSGRLWIHKVDDTLSYCVEQINCKDVHVTLMAFDTEQEAVDYLQETVEDKYNESTFQKEWSNLAVKNDNRVVEVIKLSASDFEWKYSST